MRVAALMLLDGKVVLVRHRAGSSTYHLLPGGGVDYRETVEDALVREVREETGLEAAVGRPLFVNDTIDPHGSRHVVNLTFAAEIIGGEITDTPEDRRVEAVDLVDPGELADARSSAADRAELLAALSAGSEHAPARYLGSLFIEAR